MGDPAGIGPETIVGAWTDSQVHEVCRPFVAGNCDIMRRAVQLLQANIEVVPIEKPEDARPSLFSMPCLRAGSPEAARVLPATIDPHGGQAAYDAVICATQLAQTERIAGLVTAPLNKAALNAAGHHFPGHTELISQTCGVKQTAMMLYLPPENDKNGRNGLGIVHATLHMALRDIFQHLQVERIVTCMQLVERAMRELSRTTPLAAPSASAHSIHMRAKTESLAKRNLTF